MTKVVKSDSKRPCQGAIYSDVLYVDRVLRQKSQGEEHVIVEQIQFPWAVILTQECDLERDFIARWGEEPSESFGQALLSVLAAPMYNADHVHHGTHLSDLKIHARADAQFLCHTIPTSQWRLVTQNRDLRYHYMDFPDGFSLPPVVVDFKHYFGIPAEVLALIPERCLGRLGNLDRLDLAQRFASFLTRVGLPEPVLPGAG